MTRQPKDHAGDALWFKDAIIYELHVRAFCDSNDDGIGDFRGLAQKLDYLQDLGVTTLWLLPFCPSPWRDDGYDISDYGGVHPAYGTLRDFQTVLREAHERGLRVITELVLNHTSDQHPWFQRARRSPPGSRWRDFYVWSASSEKFADARVIFRDFENSNWAWDPVAKAYYWHRFYSHQPDLNFDSAEVRRAMFNAVDFWFDLGVDGLRLDAVPYLYEREGTNCENLPETHQFLKQLRRHVDEKFRNRLLLAEANQWPEDAVGYFGDGDECHMAFHFPLMPRLFMAQRREDRFPITDILEQTPAIPGSCQWALFLRNHDELTLEMVTDEERDYMYRVYGRDPQTRINLGIRRRLAPLLGNDRRRNELMNGLLFSLPGTPIIYYGDEIGMGDNIYLGDRDGVRTPMQWNIDRNAGFSRANPQRLYLPIIIDPEYHYESVNVEAGQHNPHSLLWWMKRLIALRKGSRALSRGSLQLLQPDNHRVFAFLRTWEDETVLVLANLSRFSQPVQLDLAEFAGAVPVELFGSVPFPAVSNCPYSLALAPHSFYWFGLQRAAPRGTEAPGGSGREVVWETSAASGGSPSSLGPALRRYVETRAPRSARGLRDVRVLDLFRIGSRGSSLAVVELQYVESEPVVMLLPVSMTARVQDHAAQLTGDHQVMVIGDATADPEFAQELFSLCAARRRVKGAEGDLHWVPEKNAPLPIGPIDPGHVTSRGNTLFLDERLVLRLHPVLENGVSVEVEMSRFLQQQRFPHTPALLGSIEYRQRDGTLMTAAVLQQYVSHHGTAWTHTLDTLGRYLERALASGQTRDASLSKNPLESALGGVPPIVLKLISNYLGDAALLGKRTAQLHLTLARDPDNPDFAPEPFSDFHRIGLYHSVVGLAARCCRALRHGLSNLPDVVKADAERLLGQEAELRRRFRPLRDTRISVARIRNHGDLHLGHALWTGGDFCIFGFDGEPRRPPTERRIKRSGLRDVASMLRSFDYAAAAVMAGEIPGVVPTADLQGALEFWGRFWLHWVSASFLRGYLETGADKSLVLQDKAAVQILVDVFQIEAALHEITRHLESDPERISVPLRALMRFIDETST